MKKIKTLTNARALSPIVIGQRADIVSREGVINTSPVEHFGYRPDGKLDWVTTRNTHYKVEHC